MQQSYHVALCVALYFKMAAVTMVDNQMIKYKKDPSMVITEQNLMKLHMVNL